MKIDINEASVEIQEALKTELASSYDSYVIVSEGELMNYAYETAIYSMEDTYCRQRLDNIREPFDTKKAQKNFYRYTEFNDLMKRGSSYEEAKQEAGISDKWITFWTENLNELEVEYFFQNLTEWQVRDIGEHYDDDGYKLLAMPESVYNHTF